MKKGGFSGARAGQVYGAHVSVRKEVQCHSDSRMVRGRKQEKVGASLVAERGDQLQLGMVC